MQANAKKWEKLDKKWKIPAISISVCQAHQTVVDSRPMNKFESCCGVEFCVDYTLCFSDVCESFLCFAGTACTSSFALILLPVSYFWPRTRIWRTWSARTCGRASWRLPGAAEQVAPSRFTRRSSTTTSGIRYVCARRSCFFRNTKYTFFPLMQFNCSITIFPRRLKTLLFRQSCPDVIL